MSLDFVNDVLSKVPSKERISHELRDVGEAYDALEWHLLGEEQVFDSILDHVDLNGYEIVDFEDLAGEKSDLNEADLIMSYEMLKDSEISGEWYIDGDRSARFFIVEEGQRPSVDGYAAAVGPGEIEIRDRELAEERGLEEAVEGWKEWREKQNLGPFKATTPKAHRSYGGKYSAN